MAWPVGLGRAGLVLQFPPRAWGLVVWLGRPGDVACPTWRSLQPAGLGCGKLQVENLMPFETSAGTCPLSFCCIPLAGAHHTDSPAAGVGEAASTFVVRGTSHVANGADAAPHGEWQPAL